MRSLRTALLALISTLVTLSGQSYKTSFSEVNFDRAKVPSTFHGATEVDSASGALSLTLPLGPGIGARGARFVPTLRGRWAPKARGVRNECVNCQDLNVPGYTAGVELQSNGGFADFTQFGFLNLVSGIPGDYVNLGVWGGRSEPGPSLPDFNSLTHTNYEGPDGFTGSIAIGDDPVDNESRPSLTEIRTLLELYGFGSGWEIAKRMRFSTETWSEQDPNPYFVHLAPGGELVVGLFHPEQAPEKKYEMAVFNLLANPGPDYFGAPPPNGAVQRIHPSRILVIRGQEALEYVATMPKYGPNIRVHLPKVRMIWFNGNEPHTDRVAMLQYSRFRVAAVRNRTADAVVFHPESGVLAEVRRRVGPNSPGEATGAKIRLTSTGTEPNRTHTLAYEGVPEAPSFTYQEAGYDPALKGPFNFYDSTRNFRLSEIKNLGTGETVTLTYRPISLFFGWSTGVNAETPSSIQFPGRKIEYHWTGYPFYSSETTEGWGGLMVGNEFADGTTLYGVPHDTWLPSVFGGVDQITDEGRVTVHNRKIPIPTWNIPVLFSSTTFTNEITHPDGSKTRHTYAEPLADNPGGGTGFEIPPGSGNFQINSDADQLRTLAYLKHIPMKTEEFGTDGTTLLKVVLRDRLDLRSLNNPNGSFTRSAVPFPTRTRTWDGLNGTLTTEEVSDWDQINRAWKKSHLVTDVGTLTNPSEFPSLARSGGGFSQVSPSNGSYLRTERTTEFRKPYWTQRDLSESSFTAADTTQGRASGYSLPFALPPIEKVYDDTPFDRVKTVHQGEVGLRLTTEFTYKGSTSMDAALLKSVVLKGVDNGVGMKLSGDVGISTYEYDENGFMSAIQPRGEGARGVDWTLGQTSDVLGRPTEQKDGNGNTKTFAWDSSSRLGSVSPESPELPTTYAYDSDGLGATITRGVQVSKVRFNGLGELLWESRASGQETFYKHFDHDLAGRRTAESVWTSSSSGPAISHPHTAMEYDVAGRLKKVTDPNNLVTSYEYPKLEKKVTVGPDTTTFISDPLGRLITVVDAMGQTTKYGYDPANRIASVQQNGQAGFQTRTWHYNALGWLKQLVQPESGTTEYSDFNVLGKPQTTDYNGRKVHTIYDPLGRVTSVSSEDGTVTQDFHFDGGIPYNGKLQFSVDKGVRLDYGYGGLNGRMDLLKTELTDPLSGVSIPAFTQSFTYNEYGNRESTKLPSDRSIKYTYELARGVLNKVEGPIGPKGSFGPSVLLATVPEFNPANNPLSLVLRNGASTTFTYGADQARLATMIHAHPLSGWSVGRAWTYAWNPATGRLDGDGEDRYEYDPLGRLKRATVKTMALATPFEQNFSYDAFGNQKSSLATGLPSDLERNFLNFSFDEAGFRANNQLPGLTLTGGLTGAAYDLQGNLTQIFKTVGDTNRNVKMAYDALGRVLVMTDQELNLTEKYFYTPEGLRTRIEVYQGIPPGALVLQKVKINIYNDQRQLVTQLEAN